MTCFYVATNSFLLDAMRRRSTGTRIIIVCEVATALGMLCILIREVIHNLRTNRCVAPDK